MKSILSKRTIILLALVGAATLQPRLARAHCDTMDGPVVLAARAAFEKNDVTPVLKWIKPDAEQEIKAAFAKAAVVRTKGPEARQLAEQFFFETLVRIHRAGEGAPYTGLKPAGTDPGPAVVLADQALQTGSADSLLKALTAEAAAGIRKRFEEASLKKTRAEQDVAAGRQFVAAYVEYVHYVENLHKAMQAGHAHGAEPEQSASLEPSHAHAEASPEHKH